MFFAGGDLSDMDQPGIGTLIIFLVMMGSLRAHGALVIMTTVNSTV
jgi:hypothetical protein